MTLLIVFWKFPFRKAHTRYDHFPPLNGQVYRGGCRILERGSKTEGEARIEGAKRPRIEGEARSEGEARDKAGEGSGEGDR